MNDENNIATMTDTRYCGTVYGTINIDGTKMIYRWTFKIIQINNNELDIGIDSSNKKLCDTYFTRNRDNDYNYYSIDSDGMLISSHILGIDDEDYLTQLDIIDIIIMELNVYTSSLSFTINKKEKK